MAVVTIPTYNISVFPSTPLGIPHELSSKICSHYISFNIENVFKISENKILRKKSMKGKDTGRLGIIYNF